MTNTITLPVPVIENPRWRVNVRPATYQRERIPTLSDCLDIVEKSRVRLRGWDFPHSGSRHGDVAFGQDWVASWSDAFGHLEYWRFYQSTQFLYLGSVREVTERDWNERIRNAMKFHADSHVDIDAVPGFVTITEIIYNLTEYFEFVARLAQAQIYSEPFRVLISLEDVGGFMLAADKQRSWSSNFVTSNKRIEYSVSLTPEDSVGAASDHAIKAAIAIFERFGWRHPNRDVIRSDQQKLLTRSW